MTSGPDGRYVYAIVRWRDRAPRVRGIGGRALVRVDAGRVAALVEPMDRPPAASIEALEAQHALIRRLARRHAAILPARFGSFARDARELTRSLRSRGAALDRALRRVRGTDQMILRLFVSRPAEAPRTGAAYLRRRAGLDIPALRAVRAALEPLRIIRAERVETPITQDLGSTTAAAVTVYHLIPRNRSRQYCDAVFKAISVEPAVGAVVTGPWPPYAFAPEPAE
jgi:Gas vesicle synthesis protein GvpL/GvpF